MNRRRLCVTVMLATISMATAVVLIAASNPLVVRMTDKCEPTTFNAAVGPGT